MPKIIGIAGLTPDSGKTTAALNLSASFSVYGQRNLLVDLDPDSEVSKQIKPVMKKGQLLYKSLFPYTDFIPSGFEESRYFRRIAGDRKKSGRVFEIFMNYISEDYEYVIIDLPSEMDFVSASALAECDQIIIVKKNDCLDLESIYRLLVAVSRINRILKKRTGIFGILTWGYVIPFIPGIKPWPDAIEKYILRIFIPYEKLMDKRESDKSYLTPICFRDILNPASISYLELCRTVTDNI